MSRLRFAAAAYLGLLFLSSPLARADIPPPPVNSVSVLTSPGCAMKALQSAFAARRAALVSCVPRDDRPMGRLVLSCSFDAQGKLVQCEPDAKKSRDSRYSKREVACLQKALASLQLDSKAGDPTKCSAQIEVLSKAGVYHRPNRHGGGELEPIY